MTPSEPDESRDVSRRGLYAALFFSGFSGLSWELLWQHHASLEVGVSSYGTAITLAAMMAGMGFGGLLAARAAQKGSLRRPLQAFGFCELVIGLLALPVAAGFGLLASLDAKLFAIAPAGVPLLQLVGSFLVLIAPATAMGATLPILAPLAKRLDSHIARIYAINIAGAVSGVLMATFVALPTIGVSRTGLVAAAINLGVALWALSRRSESIDRPSPVIESWPPAGDLLLAFASGAVIFVLEVSWFRSLRAALQATTESFALILASFLIALALGGWWVAYLQKRHKEFRLSTLFLIAAVCVFLATPAVDAFDRLVDSIGVFEHFAASFWIGRSLEKLGLLLALLILPTTLLGMIFPRLLADHDTTGGTGILYAVNTAGAVVGALLAGFVLLPHLGATRTSWLAALFLIWAPLARARSRRFVMLASSATAVLLVAAGVITQGLADRRVKGHQMEVYDEILFVDEGPDSTVWVARRSDDQTLGLIIDGFAASAEVRQANYMSWMGHLPALAAAELENALVICFGTGQTVNALRQHGPSTLHVVDINESVFRAADLFETNDRVLEDPRVQPWVMDGRAYLRRRDQEFDVVTLEPMPPNFAGTNNLYSIEFYRLIESRLTQQGMVAQWLPFHLLALEDMVGIVASFIDVFPETRLWIDPESNTGVLVGSRAPWNLISTSVDLPMDLASVERQFRYGPEVLQALVQDMRRVTDDNQMLSYGHGRLGHSADGLMSATNLRLLDWYHERIVPPTSP